MRIRWTEPAVRDLTQICDYIRDRGNPSAARRVANAILASVDSLGEFPGSGREGRKTSTRELVISRLPYLVIYRLKADAVEILRILHGAQKWP